MLRRLDKVFFTDDASYLKYIIGNKLYTYNLHSNVSLEKTSIIEDSEIIHISKNKIENYIIADPFNNNLNEIKTINIINENSISEFKPNSKILMCHADENYLFLVMDKKIIITSLLMDKEIDIINTIHNPYGLFVASKNNLDTNHKLIVTLGEGIGDIILYKINYSPSSIKKEGPPKLIHAHDNKIQCIAVNRFGTYIATCSEDGGNILVFDHNGTLFRKFKRGIFSKEIYALCFNWNSTILACVSSSGTIHYYNLEDNSKNQRSYFFEFAKSIVPSISTYIEDIVWAWKNVTISLNTKAIAEFDVNNVLHIVSYDGEYYRIPCTKEDIHEAFKLEIS